LTALTFRERERERVRKGEIIIFTSELVEISTSFRHFDLDVLCFAHARIGSKSKRKFFQSQSFSINRVIYVSIVSCFPKRGEKKVSSTRKFFSRAFTFQRKNNGIIVNISINPCAINLYRFRAATLASRHFPSRYTRRVNK